ncbi:MAG TPA: recombination mediator RecR [Patescibacteria group bacterium]|nr:recombination mediator RecR [Patescibacteria group bacterium]
MAKLPKTLETLINEFSKLPGIGPKSAQRLVFYLLKQDDFTVHKFSDAVRNLKTGLLFCSRCNILAETDPCKICSDTSRNQNLICVVEEVMDALALDNSGSFRGVFHILGGVLNPLEGIGPDKLKISSLLERVTHLPAESEVILATNPTLEGEATANLIARELKPYPIKVSRIARGLPMGGDLEYSDQLTLSRALEGRRDY